MRTVFGAVFGTENDVPQLWVDIVFGPHSEHENGPFLGSAPSGEVLVGVPAVRPSGRSGWACKLWLYVQYGVCCSKDKASRALICCSIEIADTVGRLASWISNRLWGPGVC